MSDDTAPNGMPWGPLGEVPDTEWVWVTCTEFGTGGGTPGVARRSSYIDDEGKPYPTSLHNIFAPVLDVAALQEQLAAATQRAEEAEVERDRIAALHDARDTGMRILARAAGVEPSESRIETEGRIHAKLLRLKEVETACAAMRSALTDATRALAGRHAEVYIDYGDAKALSEAGYRALATDAGRGWLSPAAAEKLRRERDSYKAAAQIIGDSVRDAGTAVDVSQRKQQAAERARDDLARVLAVVGTALGAGDAEPLADAAMRVADERDDLRARVAELAGEVGRAQMALDATRRKADAQLAAAGRRIAELEVSE